jgi:hypothetical protein
MSREASTREALFADPEEVVTFAQAYYATEFPNSERRDCPHIDNLRAVARSGTLPGADLRAHLFKCSECFRSYRTARMGQRPLTVLRASWFDGLRAALSGLTSWHVPVAVGSVCLVLLGIVAAVVWRAGKKAPDVAMSTIRQERVSPPAELAVTSVDVPRARDELKTTGSLLRDVSPAQDALSQRAKKIARSVRTPSPLRIVEINLKEDGLMRGGNEADGKQRIINLSPERQRLRLQMPEGNLSGRYIVKIVDAFGKSLITTMAHSNGRTLTVDLDLRGLTAKKYRLCTERDGEAPDCYLVSINEQKRHAVK